MAEDQNTPIASAPEDSPKRLRRRAPSPTITVVIDQATIDESVQRDSSHCMIAEAIKAVAPNLRNVQVDLGSIGFTDPKRALRFTYLTPRIAQISLIYFDRGVAPKPFEFTLKTAAKITRSLSGRRKPKQPKSTEERRAAVRENGRLAKQRTTRRADELFTPAPEVVDAVLRAMDDPTAKLGPAIAIPDANNSRQPVIVGGGHPATPGNLAKLRRFGIRQYLE